MSTKKAFTRNERKNIRIDESENSISEIKHPDSSVIIFVYNAMKAYKMEMFK